MNHSSIVLMLLLAELPEVDRSMAQGTILQLMLLDFNIIHFMPTSFASVVVAISDGFTTDHACWEVAAARSANCVVF
jgi:hypothetical protein